MDVKRFKVLHLGNQCVGKLCIVNRFTNDEYETVPCTVGTKVRVQNVQRRGQKYKLAIWVIPGIYRDSERFRELLRHHFRKSQGALLVFGYDDRKSFDDIDYWLREIDEEMTRQHVILVASKSDLPEKDKQVTRTEAEMKAEELGIPFVEVSAKTGEGVNEAFNQLLDMMIENMQVNMK
ncbi:ras-related protein Rab-18-like [Ciona intestinalis]